MSKKKVIKFKLWFYDTVYIFAMFGCLSYKLSDKILKWYIDKVVVLEIKAEFPGISTETSRFIGYYFNRLRKFPGIRRARMDPNQKKILNPSIAGGWKERDFNA
jgi:hypothetical protein